MRVIVSDPQQVFRKILEHIFNELEVDCFFCDTGAELLEKAQKYRVDMIILAYNLKDQGGMELTKQLREQFNVQYTPIIIFTAKSNVERLGEAFNMGVTDVFHRDDIASFTAYVERLLNYQRKVRGRVMVVEDSPTQQKILSKILTSIGLTVEIFAEVEPAMLAHAENPFDLVLTDIVLEKKSSGLDLVHRIRRLVGGLGDVPILAVSAYAKDAMRINLLTRGVDACIAKPVIQAEVEIAARNLINGKRERQTVDRNTSLEQINKDNAGLLSSLSINQERLLTAESIAHLGYWEVNINEQRIIWSEEVFKIFDLDIENGEPSSQDFLKYVHAEDVDELIRVYQASVEDLSPFNCRFRIILNDKSIKYLHARCSVFHDPKTDSIRTKGSIQDISEQAKTENKLRKLNDELEDRVEQRTKELKRSNQIKSSFMANMSHEIRTPMNGVLGVTTLLQDTDLDEIQQKYVSTLSNSGKNLIAIINDILDYSKIEAGKFSLDKVGFKLDGLIERVFAPFEAQEHVVVELTSSLDSQLPNNLLGDEERLIQILNNFLSNALKFTEQGSVKLSVELAEKFDKAVAIKFKVTDTGIGIDNLIQENLFQPFIQADDSISRQYGGTGLGLSISKHLVELMGGEISVESEVGKGSCFSFVLNLECSDEVNAEQDSHSLSQVQYPNMRVLLVDDYEVNLFVGKGLIEKLGAKVDVAEDGEIAVKMVCEDKIGYDIIFMDCEMPVMDGYEATERIRQWQQKNGKALVDIIALTAHVLPEYKERCRTSGMTGYLSKPIEMKKLAGVFAKKDKESKVWF